MKNKIYNILIYPYQSGLPIFIALCILIPFTNGFHWWRLGFPQYAIYTFCQQFVTCYLLTVSVEIFKGFARKVTIFVLIVWAALWCLIDTFCFTEMLAPFSNDFATAIKGTNVNEGWEFFESFFTKRSLLYFVVTIIVTVVLFGLSLHYRNLFHFVRPIYISILCVILILCFPIIRNYGCLIDNPIYKTAILFKDINKIDVDKFNHSPSVFVCSPDSLPMNLVLIIGESFSRRHSSLYGYHLETNPRLQALVDSGRLFVYSDVSSPSTNTVNAFQGFMCDGDVNSKDWQCYPTIPCVFSMAGYKTFWLSNQSKYGIVDNLIAPFSELCDTSVYNGNKFSGLDHNGYDGELLPYFDNFLNEINEVKYRRLYIIHLMGSHNTFSKRYPTEWARFSPENYIKYPSNQREKMAHYDNSVLYNDFVVSEIIKRIVDKEALVFYFSDHGYDVYDTDPNYVGQGRSTNPDSYRIGTEIPMMVYVSPSFESKYPTKTHLLKSFENRELSTDTLIRVLCRVCSVVLKTRGDK